MMVAWTTTASAPAAPKALPPTIDAVLLSTDGSGDVLTYNDQALATAGHAELARVLVPVDRLGVGKIDGAAPDAGSIALALPALRPIMGIVLLSAVMLALAGLWWRRALPRLPSARLRRMRQSPVIEIALVANAGTAASVGASHDGTIAQAA